MKGVLCPRWGEGKGETAEESAHGGRKVACHRAHQEDKAAREG